MKNTYLLINVFSILFPFLYSFEKKIAFYRKWPSLFLGILGSGVFFITWDLLFTYWGVWHFNPKYITGIYLFNLPIEECMFFVAIPYASVFLYEVLKHYISKDYLNNASVFISIAIVVVGLVIAAFNTGRMYTFTAFLFTSLAVLWIGIIKRVAFMGRFYLAYLFILIPFLIVNGLLTGSYLNRVVVGYNNIENLNIRILTIPVEDTFYGMLMILLTVYIYETNNSARVKRMNR